MGVTPYNNFKYGRLRTWMTIVLLVFPSTNDPESLLCTVYCTIISPELYGCHKEVYISHHLSHLLLLVFFLFHMYQYTCEEGIWRGKRGGVCLPDGGGRGKRGGGRGEEGVFTWWTVALEFIDQIFTDSSVSTWAAFTFIYIMFTQGSLISCKIPKQQPSIKHARCVI